MQGFQKLTDQQFDALCFAADNPERKLTGLDFAEWLFPDEIQAAGERRLAGLRNRGTRTAVSLAAMGFLSQERGFFRITSAGREYLETPVPAGVEI